MVRASVRWLELIERRVQSQTAVVGRPGHLQQAHPQNRSAVAPSSPPFPYWKSPLVRSATCIVAPERHGLGFVQQEARKKPLGSNSYTKSQQRRPWRRKSKQAFHLASFRQQPSAYDSKTGSK